MKIFSDNSELLEELYSRLKIENIRVEPIRVPSKETDMSEFDLVQLIVDNPKESAEVFSYIVRELYMLYNQEHIYVETQDGERIEYEKYEAMSSEEKAKLVF